MVERRLSQLRDTREVVNNEIIQLEERMRTMLGFNSVPAVPQRAR